jgi:hypothetical protein
MTLTIHDIAMTSNQTAHAAITAMILADTASKPTCTKAIGSGRTSRACADTLDLAIRARSHDHAPAAMLHSTGLDEPRTADTCRVAALRSAPAQST